jgi:TonB dependent receptor/TonB-dependent Receptor Plug Domain
VLALGALLTVLVVPDPGSSAADATVRVPASNTAARAARDGRAALDLAPGSYEVVVDKPGFVPVRSRVVVTAAGATLRVALHAVPSAALRTIGAVAAAQRGAFNDAPTPLAVLPREGYRDQGQPNATTVLAQTPGVFVDRAARGLSGELDAPPVALVRGGTPLETQVLVDGIPLAFATTRAFALSSVPAFLTQEIEVTPGSAAPLPFVDGGVNGTLNIRLPEPATSAFRALPEVGADGSGGSFADLLASGASPDRKVAAVLAASASGQHGERTYLDTVQRALAFKARAALSPAATLTATRYAENDSDRFVANRIDLTAGELRLSGTRDALSVRAWRANAVRSGDPAGEPLVRETRDALTGAALELDHTSGANLFSLGASVTDDRGSTDFGGGELGSERVRTAFARAIVHPARKLEAQLALYGVGLDAQAGFSTVRASGIMARAGFAYRAGPTTTLRASVGDGYAPPSLVALAALAASADRLHGLENADTADLGFETRVIDARTTLSGDVFVTRIHDRLVEGAAFGAAWSDIGETARRGAELSLARRPAVGLGYLLQAWTASETPGLEQTYGDVASGATHGYAEISYHGAQGSRVSLGATYLGADSAFAQPATVFFNTNLEIQVGARGKLQFDVENLNDAPVRVRSGAFGRFSSRSAFGLAPRTVRVFLRRSIGRAGSDG